METQQYIQVLLEHLLTDDYMLLSTNTAKQQMEDINTKLKSLLNNNKAKLYTPINGWDGGTYHTLINRVGPEDSNARFEAIDGVGAPLMGCVLPHPTPLMGCVLPHPTPPH